jgi:hypothetical protein
VIILVSFAACSENNHPVLSDKTSDEIQEIGFAGVAGVSSQDGSPGPETFLHDGDGKITLPVEPPMSPEDLHVIANCIMVQTAAERFAALSGGKFPWSAYYDTTPEGWTMIDLLPNEMPLENPYTGELSEPCWLNAAEPGQTGYVGYHEYDPVTETYMNRYFINGWGAEGEIFRILKNIPAHLTNFDSLTTSHCRLVQEAAENFAAFNNGVYAGNLADQNLAGKSVIDYLPGGRLLRNPYTGAETEPVGCAAATPGQVGYVVIVDHTGTNAGYTITGFGRDRLIVTLSNW